MGKKAKKKINPNAYMEGDNANSLENPYHNNQRSLAAAGASIGHMSDYKSNQGPPNQPQELPDLDLDLGNEGDADGNDNDNDWDYKDFAGAKVGSAAVPNRPKFNINNLGSSFDADDDF